MNLLINLNACVARGFTAAKFFPFPFLADLSSRLKQFADRKIEE